MQAQHSGFGSGRTLQRFVALVAAVALVAPTTLLVAPTVAAADATASGATASTTTLHDSPAGTSEVGVEVVYKAIVTPPPDATASGTVMFSDGGKAISGCESATVTLDSPIGGETTASALCTVTYAEAGSSHSVTATYSGTETLAESTSDPVGHEVLAAPETPAPETPAPETDQAITFTSTAPADATAGGATYTPTATGGDSGNPVVFTIDASAASVCSIDGSDVVSFTDAGTCVIDANQAGDETSSPAPQVQQSVAVGAATETDQPGKEAPTAAPQTQRVLTVAEAGPIGPVLHVAQSGAGAADCSSWENACGSISQALALAASGDQVWVAAGTYTPDPTGLADPRTATIGLKNGVALYGGFAGTELNLADRDPSTHVTTLSGDIGTAGDASDNAYHVVTGSGTGATAVLDGFTVTGANASTSGANSYGGGMLNVTGSPTVRNVTFSGNAAGFGGGMGNLTSSKPTLTDVVFSDNSAVGGGGMYTNSGSDAVLTDVSFSDNSATGWGGGMANASTIPVLTNVTFTANTCPGCNGGGLYDGSAWPQLTHVTFTGNSAGNGGAMANRENSKPTLTDVTFTGNSATGMGGAIYNEHSVLFATDASFTGNSAGNTGGAMTSYYSNSTMTRVAFTGNTAGGNGGGATFTWESSATVTDATYTDNRATWTGGTGGMGGAILVYFNATTTLTNVTISGNSSVGPGGAIFDNGSSSVANLYLTNVTITANSSNLGGNRDDGALRIDGGGSHELTNVTIVGNTNGGVELIAAGAPVVRNSIIWGNSGYQVENIGSSPVVAYSDIQGGWTGTGNINADPLLGALGSYGGLAHTRPLLPGSPAIDAAESASCATNDERGMARPQGSGCDMGAFEARPFTLTMAGGDKQTAAANTAFPSPLRVTVAGSDPVTGGKVKFSAPDPEIGPSATFAANPATIGADGTASVTATANSVSGPYTVSASAAGATNTVDFGLTNGNGTLYVKADGATAGSCANWSHACSLSYALGRAMSGDEAWVAAGTHVPDATTQTDPADLRTATFQLESGVGVYGGFAGTETSRGQRSPATNVTILSGDLGVTGVTGDNAYHVVTASGTDVTAVLDGFSITAGHANSETSPNDVGGGMLVLSGSPTLKAVTFTGNYGWNGGGGMFTAYGEATLVDSTFDGNTTTGHGAGMQNLFGSPRLTGVVFSENTAADGWGGGLYSGGYRLGTPAVSPTLTNVTFIGNAAEIGGALANSMHSDPTLTNVTFVGNTATQGGGGMFNFYSSSPTLTNVTFGGNTGGAGSGGAIYNANRSSPTLTNVTFYDNSAGTGGAMSSGGNCNPTVTNSVLWGDTGGEIEDTSNCTTAITYSAVQGGHVGEGNIDADPLLGPLGTYPASAKTQTLPLLPGSAAIDAADGASCPATDQRGVTRPKGAGCDMGAYEAPVFTMSISGGNRQGAQPNAAFDEPLAVTVSGSGDPVAGGHVTLTAPEGGASAIVTGSPATIGADGTASVTGTANETLGAYEVIASTIGANPVSFTVRNGTILHATPGGATEGECDSWERACSLSRALSLALSGCQVWVANGTYTPTWRTDQDDPRTATFRVASGARLYGGFAGNETSLAERDPSTHVTIMSGDIAGNDGADFANNEDNAYQVVTGVDLAAATTIDGVTIRGGNAVTWAYQGGGLYVTGDPTLTDLTFVQNSAEEGGGMYSSGSPTLSDVTFTGNSAAGGWGGGMYSSGSPTLTRVAFEGNTAYHGGGLVNSGNASLTDVSFDGNTASGAGGGLFSRGGQPILRGVAFVENTTSGNGGGLWADRSSPRLTNVTFSDNTAGMNGGALYQGVNAMVYASGRWTLVNTFLTHASIVGNSAGQSGGAIFIATGRMTVRGSILWGDTAGSGASETDVDDNYGGGIGISHSDIQGGYGGTDNINVDPLLGPLGSYGGFVQTLPLLPGSPAIDTITTDAYPAGSGSRCGSDVGVDGRGIARPQGTLCDMGAFEARPFALAASGGDNQSALVNTAFADPLEVTVTSPSGDPVAGGNVTFAAPAIDASATLSGTVTAIGSDGKASVTATANGTEGEYTVSSSAAGATDPASFNLANVIRVAPDFTFSLSTLPTTTYGHEPFSVASYASKPGDDTGAITFALGEGSAGCTVSSVGLVTITATTGTAQCVITASLAEDPRYLAAGPISQGFSIAKATPTFTDVVIGNATYNGQPHGAGAGVSGVGSPAEALGSASVTYELRSGSGPIYTYGASATTAPTNAGVYRVTFGYTGSANYVGISDDTHILTISKAAPSCTVTPYNLTYDGKSHTATGSCTGVGGATLSGLDLTRTTHTNAGTYPDPWDFTDTTGNYNNANGTANDGIAKATLTITAANKSVQYSDPLPALTYAVTGFVNGETLATSGVTGAPTLGTPGVTVSGGNVVSGPGAYTITVAQGNLAAGNYAFTLVDGTLTVAPEDARAFYSGNALFWGTSASATSATVTLMATIKDITAVTGDQAYDPYPGDIRNATVTFVNRDAASASLTGCANRPVALVNSADTTVGTVTCTTTLSIGNSGGSTYNIGIVVSGYYARSDSLEDTIVTVAAPITSYFITGGGFLTESASVGQYAADAGTKSNFGFNVKFNKGATNLQGNVNIIFRKGGHTYQVKSNALTSLGEKPSPCTKASATAPCTANFVSKANLQDITNPNSPVSLGGNLIFQMALTDFGSPTKDTIGLTLYNGSTLLFSSNWSGTKTVEQLLGGGNLSVR